MYLIVFHEQMTHHTSKQQQAYSFCQIYPPTKNMDYYLVYPCQSWLEVCYPWTFGVIIGYERRHDIELIFNTAYEKLALLLKRGIKGGKLNSGLYVGTAASSIFGLYYHLLQGFLCGFFSEKEFKKNLRHALDMLLASANLDA